MTAVSAAIGRQVGVLISRAGSVTHVIVGDAKGILIPTLPDYPLGRRALRGLRLLHTHLRDEDLSEDDIADLSLLRLDLVAALGVSEQALSRAPMAHLLPSGVKRTTVDIYGDEFDFGETVALIEDEFKRRRLFDQADPRERALLISVSTRPHYEQEESLAELRELADTSGVLVLESVIQRPRRIHPRLLMGEGKLRETVIASLQSGATLLIFDQDLSPSQSQAIGAVTELKVIDRAQLILDIFASRAHSRDGKLQVELAQLKYRLPRLAGKGTAMSRLMGGIGGRGPGEMKLEVDRRRVRERIGLLERQLRTLEKARMQRKSRRVTRGVPIVSLVGYTNAGKSTLLNALTHSETFVEERMFATLDTASRRLRFPREREVVITDTVGFIRDLPPDLISAFRATLEELRDADLLIHLVDASSPRYEAQMESVKKILDELELSEKPCLMVLNKTDRINAEEAANMARRYGAIALSALKPGTFAPLLGAIESHIWREKQAGAKV